MKNAVEYMQEDGTYDYNQVIIDAFSGDMAQYEEYLRAKLHCSITGMDAPKLPEPYEEIYQEAYALQLQWVEAHLPQLRREHREKYGFYPIVATGE